VLGAAGQLGFELSRSLGCLGEVVAATRGGGCDSVALDLGDRAAIAHLVRESRPAVIVNAAAYTAVDRAESEPEQAHAVNAEAPAVLAAEARAAEALLVHYSTDYVFDGRAERPYREDDAPAPLNVYGRSKLAGEEAVRASGARHLILRTSWVYGARGRNFVHAILGRAAQGAGLRVVSDQHGAPTSARALAEFTAQVLAGARAAGEPWLEARLGTYHVAASGECTWYEFARHILERAGRGETPVEPVTTADYGAKAPRPLSSRLDCRRAREVFGLELEHWRRQLARVMEEIAGG